MNPLILLTIGLAIVLGGILWLRLHPFLALIVGAFTVGGLTSDEHLRGAMTSKFYGEAIRAETQELFLVEAKKFERRGDAVDFAALRNDAKRQVNRENERILEQAVSRADEFVATTTVVERITTAMGTTCAKIGLLIAMACVIGRCLLSSGAAERIVRAALSLVGPRGAPLAFSASSFVLSIPVFFDSVFLLVIPLAKASWLKLRKNYLLFVLALVTGGTMTHSLVPPTPGPLFVAEELNVSIGMMILVGMAVGLCCTAVGLLLATWLNRRIEIPVRESPEGLAELQRLSNRDLTQLPSLWVSLAPVALPVAMISGATVYRSQMDPTQPVPGFINLIGDKNIALCAAAALSLLVAAVYLRDRKALASQTQTALQEAGIIVLLCCAGGAFGATLQQSGIGPYISSMTGSDPLDFALLPLAFFVTAVIRGAQGSSTVAMFTAVAIVSSIAPDLSELTYDPVYLAVAIGCGSKPFPWMNDSGFWVISRMSGMTEAETLKTHTPMVTVMGFTGIIVTMIAARLIPMTN